MALDARTADEPLSSPDSSTVGCTSSLVGHWRLDDGAGTTARDDSCYGNNGQVVNAMNGDWQEGRLGGSLVIDPARSVHVRVPNAPSLNPTARLSMAAWIFPGRWIGGRRRILQKGYSDDQFRLWSEGNALHFSVVGPSIVNASAAQPTTGAWHHLAAVYDGAVMQVYVDGAPGASVAASGASRTTGDDLVIGTKNPTTISSDFFDGRIDDVLLYARALTAEEVAELAAGGAPPPRDCCNRGGQPRQSPFKNASAMAQ